MNRAERIGILKKLLKQRILIIDGAMGTMIQTHRLDERLFAETGLKTTRATFRETTTCSR